MMPVADLLPHADDRDYDEGVRRYVGQLADSMRQYGYNTSLSDKSRPARWMKREHGVYAYDPKPVTLNRDLQSGYTFVEPGNHRVAAAQQAGIEKIPVRVRTYGVNDD